MEIFEGIELDDAVKTQLTDKINAAIQAKLDEETTGLKSKVDELLGEKKAAQKAKADAEKAAADAAAKAAAENGDYKQLFESQKNEADTLRQQIEKMNSDITRQKITGEAARLAAQLTKDTGRAQLLQQQISQRLTIVDGELRVTDESGQLTVSKLEDLTGQIKTAYPFLVDGSPASGGGATGSKGGANGTGKTITRGEFDNMSHAQRADYVKGGGKIVNDD